MDREIAKLERRLAAEEGPEAELSLRLAQAYARAGRAEDAWLLYRDCGLQDPTLDALGRSLAKGEAPLRERLPKWVHVSPTDLPARELSMQWREEPTSFVLPPLQFVNTVSVLNPQLTEDFVRALGELPELERLDLRSMGPGVYCAHDRRLEPAALEALTEFPRLRELSLGGLVASDSLDLKPLAGFEERLRWLSLNVRGVEALSFCVLGELRGLESLELEGVRGADEVLDLLWVEHLQRLTSSFCDGLSEEGLRRFLRRAQLHALCVQDQRSLKGATWLSDLPETLSEFEWSGGGRRASLTDLVEASERLPLKKISLDVEASDDLAALTALTDLRELTVRGNHWRHRFASLAGVIPKLEVLSVSAEVSGECLALMQGRFRGQSLHAQVESAPSTLIASLGELELKSLYISAAPLTDRAAKRLEGKLRETIPEAWVYGGAWCSTLEFRDPDNWVRVADPVEVPRTVLRMARICFGLPNLREGDAWGEVEDPTPFLSVLEDAFGMQLAAVAQLGETIQDTAQLVIEHLGEHDPWA